MIATYGVEKTLAELHKQRREWRQTRGHNGKLYNPLHLGWVDRADAALATAGNPEEGPYDPFGSYYRYLEETGDADPHD